MESNRPPANGSTRDQGPTAGAASDRAASPNRDTTVPKKGQRSLQAILTDLEKPIKKRHLETKKKGGETLTFCPWYRMKRYLDHYTGGYWSKDVEMHTTDRRIFVTVSITIYASNQTATRSATGTEKLYKTDRNGELKDIAYGDPSSNAESMAFRRACAMFGLGLDLYDAE